MKARDIDTFFKEFNAELDFPMEVILTGGAAAILQGVNRATNDIDFELHLNKSKTQKTPSLNDISKALQRVKEKTNIAAQFSDDIGRWSMIVMPTKETIPYKKIGKIKIFILSPALWAIGKLTRFLATDISDLESVFRHAHVDAKKAVAIWGTALAQSPLSSKQHQFRKQVEFFLDTAAKKLWGKKTNVEDLKKIFREKAGISD